MKTSTKEKTKSWVLITRVLADYFAKESTKEKIKNWVLIILVVAAYFTIGYMDYQDELNAYKYEQGE